MNVAYVNYLNSHVKYFIRYNFWGMKNVRGVRVGIKNPKQNGGLTLAVHVIRYVPERGENNQINPKQVFPNMKCFGRVANLQ